MKLSLSIQLFLLSCVYSICCTDAVTIQSNPSANESSIETEVNKTVTLSCVVQDPVDGEELQWYRNGELVSLKDENSLEESHLCVHPVTTDDNGALFTCQLKANATRKASIQLVVNYAPDLNGSEELRAEEESDIVLSCDVRAYPPLTVVWKKGGALLDLSSSTYHTSNDGITAKLTISNVKREEHEGLYSCVATSSIYGVKSKSFIITVDDKVMKFPLGPTIAGLVVVVLTILLAIFSRRERITKCFKKVRH
ncbi:transmembrane and immunoglobulin domain-containing protein 1 [Colossoma macropomum]|uniref:transmembrane and immunoglobulin domain-containing protein 1 n=1 Tax=Colossoma macropomum TaxID=42526 RepID=UPI0018649E39|nr:transmembrane and immunoglobulin domain-containing protein 1 [Colossoma macropomum]